MKTTWEEDSRNGNAGAGAQAGTWLDPWPGPRLGIALTLAALVFGILGGFRWPSGWAATHFLFDYSGGLVRRGLPGELLSYVTGESVPYPLIATVCFAIFGAWLVLLWALVARAARTDPHIWLIAAVFFVSPGFGFLVHEIGYYDHIGLLVTLTCFLLPVTWVGFAGRVILCCAMILVHEGFLLLFLPVVAAEFWLRATVDAPRRAAVQAVILVSLTALSAFAIGKAALPESEKAAYTQYLETRADSFRIRKDAVDILVGEPHHRLADMAVRWQDFRRWGLAFLASVFLLPLSVALVFLALSGLARSPLSDRVLWPVVGALAVAAFSPVAVNVLGWDLWRFFALTQVCGLLVFLAVYRQTGGMVFPAAWGSRPYFVLALLAVLGASTAIPLFDDKTVQKPPYAALAKSAVEALLGGRPGPQ